MGMIDHFGINCANLDEATRFYDAVLATLGGKRIMDFGVAIGYGTDDHPDFWLGAIQDGKAGPNREMHVAFHAESADQVRSFYETAISIGAESLHEPRMWPEYHPGYFGAFVRDPDGNNVEAVCHSARE